MMTEDSVGGGGGGPTLGGGSAHNPVRMFFARLGQTYQGLLDKCTPHTKSRWVGTALLLVVFMLRIVLAHGWYIVTYALGIYHLNLFIAFLTPKMDPSMDLDGESVCEWNSEWDLRMNVVLFLCSRRWRT